MTEEVLLLCLVTASISYTVTETKLFEASRERIQKKFLVGEVLSCGYCLCHWVAFALVAVYRPRLFDVWWPLDYFLTALIIAWLSGIQWVLMCLVMEKARIHMRMVLEGILPLGIGIKSSWCTTVYLLPKD